MIIKKGSSSIAEEYEKLLKKCFNQGKRGTTILEIIEVEIIKEWVLCLKS